jgi:hypothetical protein
MLGNDWSSVLANGIWKKGADGMMRKSVLGMERVLENVARMERFFGNLEQNQPERHVRNAVREMLLASRSVMDSVIQTLEEDGEEPSAAPARKIKITNTDS